MLSSKRAINIRAAACACSECSDSSLLCSGRESVKGSAFMRVFNRFADCDNIVTAIELVHRSNVILALQQTPVAECHSSHALRFSYSSAKHGHSGKISAMAP